MRNNINFDFIISVILYFLLPFYLIVDAGICSVPALLTFIVIIYLIFKLITKRRDDFLYASFLSFFYVFLLLAPILQISIGQFPWFDHYLNRDIDTSWWITFLSLVFFEIGYNFKKNIPSWRMQHNAVLSNKGYVSLFFSAVILLMIGLYLNGVQSLFLPRNVFSSLHENTVIETMINTAILRVPATFVLILFFQDLIGKHKETGKYEHKLAKIIMCAIIFLAVIVVNNPISTPRFWVGAMVFSLFIVYLKHRTSKGASYWLKVNIFVLVLAFPITDIFRNSLESNLFDAIADSSPMDELTYSPDFDAFQQQLNTVVYVDYYGSLDGLQMLSSILFFVPRNYWEGKSEASGLLVAKSLSYDFLNLSSPITAEFYLDFKFIGVVFGMIFLGVFYKILNDISSGGGILILTLYGFFCSYQVYFLRGSLMAVIPFLFIFVLLFVMLNVFKNFFFIEKK
jgi:hypothetical protein